MLDENSFSMWKLARAGVECTHSQSREYVFYRLRYPVWSASHSNRNGVLLLFGVFVIRRCHFLWRPFTICLIDGRHCHRHSDETMGAVVVDTLPAVQRVFNAAIYKRTANNSTYQGNHSARHERIIEMRI